MGTGDLLRTTDTTTNGIPESERESHTGLTRPGHEFAEAVRHETV